MNYIQKQAALQKLAQVRLAINYVMRNRGMKKQALGPGIVNEAVLAGISPAMSTPLGQLSSGARDGFQQSYNNTTRHLDPVYKGKIQHKYPVPPKSNTPLYRAGYNAGMVPLHEADAYLRSWYPEYENYINNSSDAQWKAHMNQEDYKPAPGPDIKKMKPRLGQFLRSFGL